MKIESRLLRIGRAALPLAVAGTRRAQPITADVVQDGRRPRRVDRSTPAHRRLAAGLLAAMFAFPAARIATAQQGASDAFALDPTSQIFALDLASADATATGTATVVGDPAGPDDMLIRVQGLDPATRYTVFLTQSQTLGGLPAKFVGEMTTDGAGGAKLRVQTEVINAFASANQSLEDPFGIADVTAAGALSQGANTIPLDWIRIYRAVGNISVFGPSENVVGGALGMTSVTPIPKPEELASRTGTLRVRGVVTLGLIDGSGSPAGRATILNDPSGIESLTVRTQGQAPNTRYTVFMANSQTLGALPADLIGEYVTDASGSGRFHVSSEINNVFASANQSLEDAFGVADVVAAGALANGANTISLDWIRIYLASGQISVFGGSEVEVGGGLALTSARPLPPTPVAQAGPPVVFARAGETVTLTPQAPTAQFDVTWTQIDGPAVDFTAQGDSISLQMPDAEVSFELRVSDFFGETSTDQITLARKLVISANGDLNFDEGERVNLCGVISGVGPSATPGVFDIEGPEPLATFQQIAGPPVTIAISSLLGDTPGVVSIGTSHVCGGSFSMPVDDVTIRATATDDRFGQTDSLDVTLTANPVPLSVTIAGDPVRTVSKNSFVILDADTTGTVLSVEWTQIAGRAGTLTPSSNTASLFFSAPGRSTDVVLRVVVTGRDGMVASDEVKLLVR